MDYSNEQRRALLKQGMALRNPANPNRPAFPIKTRADMTSAIDLAGHSSIDQATVRRFLIRVMRKKGWTDMIPDSWK